jgi:hypothetical protein
MDQLCSNSSCDGRSRDSACWTCWTRISFILPLRNLDAFMTAAGLTKDQWSKRLAMDPTVSIRVDADCVERFTEFLRDLHICDVPTKMSAKEGGREVTRRNLKSSCICRVAARESGMDAVPPTVYRVPVSKARAHRRRLNRPQRRNTSPSQQLE